MALALASFLIAGAAPPAAGGRAAVEALFADWRAFETPPSQDGAPDYRAATFERRRAELARLRQRLKALAAGTTATDERIDLALLGAEMNGFDFNLRVLKPWARDPAFYATVRTVQVAYDYATARSRPIDAALRSKLEEFQPLVNA